VAVRVHEFSVHARADAEIVEELAGANLSQHRVDPVPRSTDGVGLQRDRRAILELGETHEPAAAAVFVAREVVVRDTPNRRAGDFVERARQRYRARLPRSARLAEISVRELATAYVAHLVDLELARFFTLNERAAHVLAYVGAKWLRELLDLVERVRRP